MLERLYIKTKIIYKMTLKTKLNITLVEATKSREKFKMAAILWQGSKIKGVATNININFFEPCQKNGKRKGGLHAEALAIVKGNSNRVDWKKATLTVARVGKSGLVRNAKPCKDCMRLIRRVGIKNVCWTQESPLARA